jgi:hypothetical protein
VDDLAAVGSASDGSIGLLFAEHNTGSPHAKRLELDAPSDSEDELDLDEVARIRRLDVVAPPSERAKRGWLAHQSVFPPSASSESSSQTEKDTESASDDVNDGEDGGSDEPEGLNIPLLGDGFPHLAPPARLQVSDGRFAHWDASRIKKYHG